MTKVLDPKAVRELEEKLNSQFKDFSKDIDKNVDDIAKNIGEKGSKILAQRSDTLKTAAIVAGIVTTIAMITTIAVGAAL